MSAAGVCDEWPLNESTFALRCLVVDGSAGGAGDAVRRALRELGAPWQLIQHEAAAVIDREHVRESDRRRE